MTTEYNYIYDKLVKDKDDVRGIIAYSIYKRQKIEYIRDHGDSNLQAFNKSSQSDTQLNMYLNEADNILSSFAEIYLETDLQEREEYFKAKLKSDLDELKPKFSTGVYQSIIGSFGFVLVLGLLVFISWSAKMGVKPVIESIFEVSITSQASLEEHSTPPSPET